MKTRYLIIAGVALVAGYLISRHKEVPKTAPKNEGNQQLDPANVLSTQAPPKGTTNTTKPLTVQDISNSVENSPNPTQTLKELTGATPLISDVGPAPLGWQ